jgi:hypothetical protein
MQAYHNKQFAGHLELKWARSCLKLSSPLLLPVIHLKSSHSFIPFFFPLAYCSNISFPGVLYLSTAKQHHIELE